MGILNKLIETRGFTSEATPSLVENRLRESLFGASPAVSNGVFVNESAALGITAVWQAVNMISSTMATIPLKLMKASGMGRVSDTSNPLYAILHQRVNKFGLTSQAWRKMMMQRLLLEGRAFSRIERNRAGRVMGLYYLDPSRVRVALTPDGFGRQYFYRQPDGTEIAYDADDMIDLVWMYAADGFTHMNPVSTLKNALSLTISAERYASRVFANGGFPNIKITGPLTDAKTMARAAEAIEAALQGKSMSGGATTLLPEGYDAKEVGFDPMKAQMIDLRKIQVSEVARIYNISPSLLMDMSTGTFANVEAQDLAFAKHCVHHWTELWENELNVKLLGDRNTTGLIEFSLDGLQRGDFASRTAGLAQRIQNGILTVNEARALENLPPVKGGDEARIQQATVPLSQAVVHAPAAPSTVAPDPEDEESTDATTDDSGGDE